MADRNLERRQERGMSRRGDWGLSNDLFTMSPFTLMRRLTEDMDRMFTGTTGGAMQSGQSTGFIPPVEIREEQGNLMICAELPGINKEDVKVEVQNDALVIQGERKREWSEEKGGVHRSERSYGSFYRAIPLPDGANPEQARAEFRDGMLEIRVPVSEQASRSRSIPIESGGERRQMGAEQQRQEQSKTLKAG